MKILIVLNCGWEFGGGEIITLNLKKELEKKGHIVKIFSSNSHIMKKHFSDYEFKNLDSKVANLIFQIFNFKSYFNFKQVLREFKPNVVHIQNIDGQVTSSILLSLKKIPTIMRIDSFTNLCPTGKIIPSSLEICNQNFGKNCIKCVGLKIYLYSKFKYIINQIMFKNVDLFITPSNYMKNTIKKNKFIRPIKSVHNGIKLLKHSKIKKGNNLLCIGRIIEKKGVEYLLIALSKVIKKIPRVYLNVIGDGKERDNLINLTKKLKIDKNVVFIRQVPHNKIEKYYQNSSIVLVPSVCPESFCLIGPEAMSVGRPVIASNVGGIPEWLDDGKTGYLIEPRNPKKIAGKIIKLLLNPKLMQEMGVNARKKAEQFSIKKHVKEIEKIYQKVINKYKN